jgi:two-component system nitrate/nitrite response regulator NarL
MRILLIADDPLARAGLSTLLTEQEDIEIAMQFASDDPGLSGASSAYAPEAVLWDVGWDAADDFERLADFVEIGPPVVVLLADTQLARDVWTAGARGIIDRDASGTQIAVSLNAASHNLVIIDPEMASILPLARAAADDELIVEPLTPRELEVVQLLAEGATNKAIARQLAVSEHTIKYHVNAILGKLGAQSRTEAVVRATRAGLILL